MFVSARMKKAQILTLVSDEPMVAEAVGEMGVLHLTRAPVEGGASPVEGPESRESEAHLTALQARSDALCNAFGLDDAVPPETVPHWTIREVEDELGRVEAEVGGKGEH